MTSYVVNMRLAVRGPSRAEHFERVVDRYAELERRHAALLDCAWALSEETDHGDVDVSVTVTATDDAEAWALASSGVRSAIHDAGGQTPDWGDHADDPGVVAYRITEQDVAPV